MSVQQPELNFLIQTSDPKLSKDDRFHIRRHARRVRHRKQSVLKPWILTRGSAIYVPRAVALSPFDIPPSIRPYMHGDIASILSSMREALYPPQICLEVDPYQSTWTQFLLTDQLYLQCTLFAVEAYLDLRLERENSPLTHFHLAKTLRLLQDRLADSDLGSATSDATIMTVTTLGLTTELVGDAAAAEKHMAGLKRMVDLRGGLGMLMESNERLPAKICRVDLCLAIRFGIDPALFDRTSIRWDGYLENTELLSPTNPVTAWISALDWRLVNVFKDLCEFARLSNLASQTLYKLTPNTFSNILVSALYRLLALGYASPAAEAFRLGLVTVARSIFFQWRGLRDRQECINRAFGKSLMLIGMTHVPTEIKVWLFMVWAMDETEHRELGVSSAAIQLFENLGLETWEQARQAMRATLWVDFLYKDLCQEVFLLIQAAHMQSLL